MSSDPADPRGGGDWGDSPDDAFFTAASLPEIPDDARELDRDVEAWRREVRWQRRKRRVERWTGPGAGHGQLPGGAVVVVVLVVGLIGAMLVVFTPKDARRPVAPVPLALAAPEVAPGSVGGLLPDTDLTTSEGVVLHARDLRPTVLALVPANCDCVAALKTLVNEADAAGMLPVEMIATASQSHQLEALSAQVGANLVVGLRDIQSSLIDALAPRGLSSLTVVPVHSDGVIAAVVPGFTTSTSVEHEIEHLAQPGFDQIAADTASP
jgi:hypothetical protein